MTDFRITIEVNNNNDAYVGDDSNTILGHDIAGAVYKALHPATQSDQAIRDDNGNTVGRLTITEEN